MIPLPVNIPWKLIGWAVLVAGVAAAGWRVTVWHDAYGELQAVQARLAAEESCEEKSKCRARETTLREELEREKTKVVDGLEAELAGVRSRPARAVRVCPDPSDVPVSRAAGRGHGAAAGAGLVPGQAGPDIGADLYGLAREADEIVARCRALQDWNRALAAE